MKLLSVFHIRVHRIYIFFSFQSPSRLTAMGYQDKIEQATAKIGAKFIEYRIDTGSWVFEVSKGMDGVNKERWPLYNNRTLIFYLNVYCRA